MVHSIPGHQEPLDLSSVVGGASYTSMLQQRHQDSRHYEFCSGIVSLSTGSVPASRDAEQDRFDYSRP